MRVPSLWRCIQLVVGRSMPVAYILRDERGVVVLHYVLLGT